MKRMFLKAVVCLGPLCAWQVSNAQPLTYADCVVHDLPSLQASLSSFYDTLEGGPRPTIYLDQYLFNGEFDVTHRVIMSFPDHEGMQTMMGRMINGPAALLVAGRSFEHAADCRTDGLTVFRGAWGNQNVQPVFWQLYGVSTSDGAAYAAALESLAEAQGDAVPGPMLLFENRAGISSDTHLVVVGAPTLAGLNEYLDELFASDDFEDFREDVGSIRSITWRAQAVRINTWAPDDN